jgi:ATP-dependent DNA helicase DinG
MKKRAKKKFLSKPNSFSKTIPSVDVSADILSNNGLLSQAITGFAAREPQQKMAEAIERAIKLKASLIVEAGTGTGKTFGYLVPIFLAQKKTIISTGTKNLQDQLFFNDIPLMKKIFPLPRKVILLKGRANYLCRQRIENSLQDGRFIARQYISQLHLIDQWSHITQIGDIAEITTVPEDSAIWPHVTSTTDNCLSQHCPFYKDCFVVKARQEALAADILVVNHHLFFADMALQDEGFGELLPGAEVVIFDEAHHLPDIASQFFSLTLTGRQLTELARDSQAEMLKEAKDMKIIGEQAGHLQKTVQEMRTALGTELRRALWPDPLEPLLAQCTQAIKTALQLLEDTLKKAAIRGKGLENCWRRTLQLIERFTLLTQKIAHNTVHWFETHPHSFTLQVTPIVVADQFQDYLKTLKRTCIFTSATLTVKNSFRLFVDTLGLDKLMQLQLKSPFDYQRQALLYVPRGLPDPRASHYTDTIIEAIIPVIEATQGKAFVLFTSYKALEYAAQKLKNRLVFPLLLQGTLPKRQLIEEFKRLGNAVLLGTSSFWYGVDVRGDALSCVIIDKLPFAAPGDPVLCARISMLHKQGIDPFQNYQLPCAVLTLKQGAGRLIRDGQDRGILMICDPRLVAANYGETFLQSLPDMPRTRDLSKVREFLNNENTCH